MQCFCQSFPRFPLPLPPPSTLSSLPIFLSLNYVVQQREKETAQNYRHTQTPSSTHTRSSRCLTSSVISFPNPQRGQTDTPAGEENKYKRGEMSECCVVMLCGVGEFYELSCAQILTGNFKLSKVLNLGRLLSTAHGEQKKIFWGSPQITPQALSLQKKNEDVHVTHSHPDLMNLILCAAGPHLTHSTAGN